jgi:O-antigen ligase
VVSVANYKGILSYSWLLQPVHNIFLLVFAEAGIFGLLLLSYLMYKCFRTSLTEKNYPLTFVFVFIVFTGLFDHYWLTLQQNVFLLSIFIGLCFRRPELKTKE